MGGLRLSLFGDKMKKCIIQLTDEHGKSIFPTIEQLFAEMLKPEKKEKTLSQMNHEELVAHATEKKYDVDVTLVKAKLYAAIKKIEK